MSDLLIAKYFDFLLFNKIKAGFLKSAKESVYEISPDFSNTDLVASYNRLILASQDILKMRQSGLGGLPLPALGLWRTSEPTIPQEAYGRSVLKRGIYVPPSTPGGTDWYYGEAPVVDWEFEYHIYAESYFSSYVSRVTQDLIQFDMLRYVEFDMSDYIPGFTTVAELKVGKPTRTTLMTEAGGSQRNIAVDIPITLKVTVPIMGSNFAIDTLIVLLNGQQIFTYTPS